MVAPARLVDKTQDINPLWSFDVTTGLYRSNVDGHTVTAERLRTGMEDVVAGAKNEAYNLVEDLRQGRKKHADWEHELGLLIIALHTAGSTLATGGLPSAQEMAAQDLRAQLAREMAYLVGFGKQVQDSVIKASPQWGVWSARAASYMDAALITYERQRHQVFMLLGYKRAARFLREHGEHCPGCVEEAEKGFVNIEDFVPLGLEECTQWCQCSVEYSLE